MYNEKEIAALLPAILDVAFEKAHHVTNEYINDKLKGEDNFPCGFAWVNIISFKGKTIRKNSKIGKVLESYDIKKSNYEKGFRVWNPSGVYFQNVDCKYAGALAFADHMESMGFGMSATSRWD